MSHDPLVITNFRIWLNLRERMARWPHLVAPAARWRMVRTDNEETRQIRNYDLGRKRPTEESA